MQKYQPCVNEFCIIKFQENADVEKIDPENLPSILCPIFACFCCWPLGIGALASFLDARDAIQTENPSWFESAVRYTKIFSGIAIGVGTSCLVLFTILTIWCFINSNVWQMK